MKRIFYTLLISFVLFSKAFSQPISLPRLYPAEDTVNNYYITFCEEFYDIFRNIRYHYSMKLDSCMIDFDKYDLKGTRQNGVLNWELVSPKKYCEETYNYLTAYDTIYWKVFHRNMVVQDTGTFNKLKKNIRQNLKDSFDFTEIALIYNDVWVDCLGHFYYKILYDPIENILVCNLIEIYGGSCGMCPRDSWIIVRKPYPDTKIILKEF